MNPDLIKTLLEALNEAIDNCNDIEDDNEEKDEWTEAAEERKARYLVAIDELEEIKKNKGKGMSDEQLAKYLQGKGYASLAEYLYPTPNQENHE